MKKSIIVFLLLIMICLCFTSTALANGTPPNFAEMFDDNGAVMLLIDSQTGSIVYANEAAAAFYGYAKLQLQSMNIDDINTLSAEDTNREMQAAVQEKRSYYVFKHRLASGEIRTVEVFSCPHTEGGKIYLFSIIHDITSEELLEGKHQRLTNTVIIVGSCLVTCLLFAIFISISSYKKLKTSNNQIKNFNALRKSYNDANDSWIYLKDENLKYVFVNRAFELNYGKSQNEIIGLDDFELAHDEFAEKGRKTDLAVLQKEALAIDEVEWDGRVYKTTKFPVQMMNGRFGVGAYITDITKEHEQEKKQKKVLLRNQILVETLNRSFRNRQEQLDYVLHQSLKLTESQYGYIYLYNEENYEFTLNSWTKGVMDDCSIIKQQTKYELAKTGIWGEVVRQRKPIVVNDFNRPNPFKKGYPKGHVELKRFMSIPIMIDEKIVAVVGLANKQTDYDDNDVYEMTMLMSGTWNAVDRRDAQERLAYERNKYLQTLVSIGDGVMVVDHDGRIEMLNTVAQKLTGWRHEDAQGKYYKEVFVLSHEQEGFTINDPIEGVFATDQIQELGNHAMLTSRDGLKYYLEDSAAPIKDETNNTMGVVLVFRDVTDKKKQITKIEYLSFHDSLTGLYNRRFFEEGLHRLDVDRNLPLSIIMGDVNGLKLTNDIFGHAFGDMLLEKVAEVLKNACRTDDIIARWGGDEFALLLPKTSTKEVEAIVARIKEVFGKEHIMAIKGSISLGFDVKHDAEEDIMQVLNNAEEKMYLAKTLERDQVSSNAITAIITALHGNSVREKDHSIHVSQLCQKLGRALKLPEGDVRKLKDAGYLHDIGKIVLEPKLLNKNYRLTDQEWEEMKKHATVGYRILNSFDNTMDLAESVLAHHERWDGKGYPKGIKGEEIPLLARIISIVESYDRMIHDSENTRGMKCIEALHVIRENAGIQYDPRITEMFISLEGDQIN